MKEQRTPGFTIAGVLVLSVAVGLVAWLMADLWPGLIAAWPGHNDDLVRVLQVVRDSRVEIGVVAGSVTLAGVFVLAQAWHATIQAARGVRLFTRWVHREAWPVAQRVIYATGQRNAVTVDGQRIIDELNKRGPRTTPAPMS